MSLNLIFTRCFSLQSFNFNVLAQLIQISRQTDLDSCKHTCKKRLLSQHRIEFASVRNASNQAFSLGLILSSSTNKTQEPARAKNLLPANTTIASLKTFPFHSQLLKTKTLKSHKRTKLPTVSDRYHRTSLPVVYCRNPRAGKA